jgi:hypothetical protein
MVTKAMVQLLIQLKQIHKGGSVMVRLTPNDIILNKASWNFRILLD